MTSSPFSVNEKVLMNLIKAKNENEVEKILQDNFFANVIWKPLGGTDNNFATVQNQQSNPVDALCEKPINSIDHYLLKRCKLAGAALLPGSHSTLLRSIFLTRGRRTASI